MLKSGDYLVCKKDYYDDMNLVFDGKDYWRMLYGRKIYKIKPLPPIFKKDEIYYVKYGLYNIGTYDFYQIKSNNTFIVFHEDELYKTFYTKIEERAVKLKRIIKK